MLVKYLLLYFVLLCSRQLVRCQFGDAEELCKDICQPWEGYRFKSTTICHQRYKDCLQAFDKGYFNDKGRILYNAVKAAVDNRNAVPCVYTNTKKEMKGTYCRQSCNPDEFQLELPLEVCEAGKHCCTGNSEKDIYKTTEKPKGFFWADSGIIQDILATTEGHKCECGCD